MTDSLERFLEELHFDVPAGLTERAKAAVAQAEREAPSRHRRSVERPPWALALVAALIAVAIVLSLLLTARALHSRQFSPVNPIPHREAAIAPCATYSPPKTIDQLALMKMVTPTTGWADGPLRTTDGGMHWAAASPPSIPRRAPGNAEFFLDATRAWVAETGGSATACADHVVTFRTTDGGTTWQQGSVISIKVADPTDVIWSGAGSDWMYFIDPMRGWLIVESGPYPFLADRWRVGAIYATTNGGQSWKLLSRNSGFVAGCRLTDGIYFASAATGWIRFYSLSTTSSCGVRGPGLLVTHDGGITWAVQALPVSTDGIPTFFDAKHALILGNPILVSSDGGVTWKSVPTPSGVFGITFINLLQGWAIVSEAPDMSSVRLYSTQDGGMHWTAVGQAFLLQGLNAPIGLAFVDANNGFLTVNGGLLRTSDGGASWTQVQAAISSPAS